MGVNGDFTYLKVDISSAKTSALTTYSGTLELPLSKGAKEALILDRYAARTDIVRQSLYVMNEPTPIPDLNC